MIDIKPFPKKIRYINVTMQNLYGRSAPEVNDREMIREIRRGKKEYLNNIAEKYYDDIFRFCCYQIGNYQEAGDLTQETFLQVLTGLASVLLQISITLYLSSKCRRPVTSVMAGLFLYLLPFGMNEVMFQLLAALGTAEYFWGWILMDVIRICCFSMPVYLPNPGILFIPSNWLRYIPVIAAAVLILCIWRGYQNYRNYEKNR